MSSRDDVQDSIDKVRQAFRKSADLKSFWRPPDPPPPVERKAPVESSEPPEPVTREPVTREAVTRGEPEMTAGITPQTPTGLHPFFRGLLDALPQPGSEWTRVEREQWLETARSIFTLVYREPVSNLPSLRALDAAGERVDTRAAGERVDTRPPDAQRQSIFPESPPFQRSA